MLQITATVKERGVRQPGLVRPDQSGGYEIIAGERRYQASELASLKDMPVIVREMSDEETVTELVDSNIQREDVLPSERAWSYRMRLEVVKRQGERTDLTSLQNSAKFRRTSRRWCWTRWSIRRTPPPCPRPSG
nr:ParB/RepB/Spo0J family partition protein [uncultured Eisenbergiella sp.]